VPKRLVPLISSLSLLPIASTYSKPTQLFSFFDKPFTLSNSVTPLTLMPSSFCPIISIVFGHYNPVGHQLVDAPCNWPYSSFRRYVEQGVYPNDWGADREITFQDTVGWE
jgi:hypothetical protein